MHFFSAFTEMVQKQPIIFLVNYSKEKILPPLKTSFL